jgi:hypothetical protein
VLISKATDIVGLTVMKNEKNIEKILTHDWQIALSSEVDPTSILPEDRSVVSNKNMMLSP